MPLFIIDTISTFRLKYAIEAETLEHAYDEITMKDSSNPKDQFEEFTQKHLGENIIDGHEITYEQYNDMMNKLKDNKDELASYWMGEKMIRKIDYGNEEAD